MHLTENQIKAYLDDELDEVTGKQVETHLDDCTGCQADYQKMAARAERLRAHIQMTAPQPSEAAAPLLVAHARFKAYTSRKEKDTMWRKLFNHQYRSAWVALGLILILVAALAIPPVRAIATSFLGLFRVQQFAVVQVNPENLPEQLGSSAQLESMLSQDVRFEEFGEPLEVASAAEASEMAGITVRLPTAIDGEGTLSVTPAANVQFDIDLQRVQALLDEIGYADVELPTELDGETVSVEVFEGVMAMYGECEYDPDAAREEGYDPDDANTPRLPRCTTLTQIPSPAVSAPPGLDIGKIGEAFLQIMGMSPEEAAHFSENIDWTTTLVVPIPMYGTEYRDLSVDGVTGTLITHNPEDGPRQYLLMWVKEGIIYTLTGPGNSSTALNIADSLE